jgi:ADP-ribose pyrophosphatase YjhB (NUDIX family)
VTPERARLLGELLTELAVNDKWRIHDLAFLPAQKAFSLPYAAILILRKKFRWSRFWKLWRREILLVLRGENETYPKQWHIPGRMWRWNDSEADACRRTAQEELGIDIKNVRSFDFVKWMEHEPGGRPIECFFIVETEAPVVETETIRFFPLEELPNPMVPYHPGVIKKLWKYL